MTLEERLELGINPLDFGGTIRRESLAGIFCVNLRMSFS